VALANGFCYQLQLVGNEDPVEQRPDFESIMDGFDFTSPPVPKTVIKVDRRDNVSYRMGQIAGYCLIAALVIFVAKKFLQRT
jgi:hypothetical protein